MVILCAKPLGFSLLCLVIVFGATHGYETISIAQPPCTALPPASAPVSIAQPPENTVLPPASAPTSIPEPPTTAIPPGIAQPPCSSGLPPTSAPISIPEPPTTAIPPGIAQPPCNSGLPPASAPVSISEPPVTAIPPSIAQQPCGSVFPPASAPTSIAEPPSSTVLPPAYAPSSTSEPPTAAIPPSIAQPPCSTAPVQEAPSDMLIPPKKLVAVQGMVYCKPCDNRGVENLSGAAPLQGAVVKLQCKNTKYPLVVQTKTDKNGKFFIKAPNTVTTYKYHKCRVLLVESPAHNCNTPSNLNNGLQGAMLMRSSKPPGSAQAPVDFELFSVGPFAFGHKLPCPSSVH